MMGCMLRLLALFLFLLMCLPSPADHQIFTRSSPQKGWLSFLDTSDRMDVHIFRAKDFALMILDEGDEQPRYGSLSQAMRENNCRAGINGGYFATDERRSPLGLIRHKGITLHPLASGRFTVAGVLYDTGREIRLERSNKLTSPPTKMKEAIQGGPFLVEAGKRVEGLERSKKARRTFVATDERGSWCIGVTSPLTLHELSVWLSTPGSMGDFRVMSALNMDGGTSSAFWDSTDGTSLPGFKDVRNYVGLIPRSSQERNLLRTK